MEIYKHMTLKFSERERQALATLVNNFHTSGTVKYDNTSAGRIHIEHALEVLTDENIATLEDNLANAAASARKQIQEKA